MATISNVRLSIEQGTPGTQRRVTVTYRINFSATERLAGSVFVERVTLRGSDVAVDDDLASLYTDVVKAPVDPSFVDRSISEMVSRDTLDEDSDFLVAMRDEIYARVTLQPFMPMSASAESNLVSGQFGSRGSD